MCLVVKENDEYLIYKSFQNSGFPPCKLTEAKLREKLNPANLPTAQLASIFIINANIFQPYNKCYCRIYKTDTPCLQTQYKN
ncbi:hypothetical protein B9Z55_000715 [Caenorhabditis nigoni]|uniref:Uncharacterized protein n=1 Tax=Caenorhabditis nigoni TaxID=1611254 RepID=A0A2G5VUS3_9PELO|nr:hypothetical protein B9Z55_000715 [Caenorhabditis nigoni]